MAQLLNLKFFLYLCWLGVGSSPLKASRRNVVKQFRNPYMNDNFDEIIDFLLTTVRDSNGIEKINLLLKAENSVFKIERNKLSLKYYNFMIEKDLISLDVDNKFRITKNGLDIFNNGGWLKYIKDEKIKLNLVSEKETIDFEKSKIDLELNKWLLKTKWLPHIITIISLLFAVYVYFDSKNDSKKLEERIENLESTITTLKNVSKK